MTKPCGRCGQMMPSERKHRWCFDCGRAYQQQYYAEHHVPRPPLVKPCKRCSQPIKVRGGRLYCPPCSLIAKREEHRQSNRRVNEKRAAAPQICSTCRQEYPAGRKGYHCADCEREYQRQRATANPQRERERQRRWREQNPEKYREKWQRWRANHPEITRAARCVHQRKRKAKLTQGTARGKDYLAVLAAANGICALCGQCPGEKLHIDHIIPLSRGGQHSRDNLQALCQPCNQRKYNKLPEEL